MTRASTIIEQVTKDIQQRVRAARKEAEELRENLQCHAFEQRLVQQLIAKAQTVQERDEWEFEKAALECISSAQQQEMRLLEAEIFRNECLLEAAKRHGNP